MQGLRIVIPAAGASARMRGGDKLLEPVEAMPLLRRQALLALGLCADVVVTLRPSDVERHAVLRGLTLQIAWVVQACEGMAASIRAGSLGASGSVMILPADMPELDQSDLQNLIRAHSAAPQAIWRGASAAGLAGHPVIFPADLVVQLQRITGDAGARAVLSAHPERIRLCPLAAEHALTDLDTPEDWRAWRAKAQRAKDPP